MSAAWFRAKPGNCGRRGQACGRMRDFRNNRSSVEVELLLREELGRLELLLPPLAQGINGRHSGRITPRTGGSWKLALNFQVVLPCIGIPVQGTTTTIGRPRRGRTVVEGIAALRAQREHVVEPLDGNTLGRPWRQAFFSRVEVVRAGHGGEADGIWPASIRTDGTKWNRWNSVGRWMSTVVELLRLSSRCAAGRLEELEEEAEEGVVRHQRGGQVPVSSACDERSPGRAGRHQDGPVIRTSSAGSGQRPRMTKIQTTAGSAVSRLRPAGSVELPRVRY